VSLCAHEGCGKRASFNTPDQTKGSRCKKHAELGMEDVVSKRCAGCKIRPTFNVPGQKGGIRCEEHAEEGMEDVCSRQCAHEGCKRQPKFNTPGEKGGIWCTEHAKRGMRDVVSRQCAHEGCERQPRFNTPGEKGGMWCAEHAAQGMKDVCNKRCAHGTCTRLPSFNMPGEKGGLYCEEHAKKGMRNVHAKRCAHETCERQPSFNVPGKPAIYCEEHAKQGMGDVRSKKCAHAKCELRPSFNAPDQTKPILCKEHKLEGMIGVGTMKCQAKPCRAVATHGKDELHRAQFCFDHKRETDVRISDALMCGFPGCPAQYEFVVEEGTHKVCLAHAPPGYEAALKRMCKYCDIREDVPFVCVGCRQRMHKKEHAVVRHFRRTLNAPLKYDESPGYECTKKRPDIRFETPTHDVVVEVDENQHRGYEESCECARISELVGAIGGKSVVFVRYNPDTVRFGGHIHTVPAAERIDLLVATVKHELQRESAGFEVRLVQLWYDAPAAEAKREMDITRLVAI
jgi:hypothetical protein